MTLTLTLTPDKETRLQEQADRAGLSPEEYVQSLIDSAVATASRPASGPVSPTLALFHRWSAEDATDDAEEIKRRTQETEELTAALAANPLSLRVSELPDDTDKERAA